MDEADILGVFSIPWELRLKRFAALKQSIDAGTSIESLVAVLADESREKGYTLGYHISPTKIRSESADGNAVRSGWKIGGYEFDDRDNRPMAYYSLDYKNLYRKKRGAYLYVIRAELGEATDQKKDTTNNWGRASTLAIVAEFPIADIDEEVARVKKEIKDRQALLQGGSSTPSKADVTSRAYDGVSEYPLDPPHQAGMFFEILLNLPLHALPTAEGNSVKQKPHFNHIFMLTLTFSDSSPVRTRESSSTISRISLGIVATSLS